jgi:hypothetical protein
MRCTIHLATAQDVANVLIGHKPWSRDVDENSRHWLNALLEACAMSRQVWTAANAHGEPLAFIGAAPFPEDAGRGRLWFVVLEAYDGNDGDLKSVMRLTVVEMLQVFAELENHVGPEKAWALELMRDAGFTVEPALASPDGVCRHRVWIDAGTAGSSFSAA